jgi:RNA polymerase sigma-70 factor (ECF subfamily)
MHAFAAPSAARSESPRFVAFAYASELLRRHGAYLEALARRKCRNTLDPDDLVQDVFEKVMRTAQPIPEGVNEQAWLSRVLHNLFIDKLRRRAARAERALYEPIAAPTPDGTWWQELTEDEVRATVARLPEKQRVAFELFAFESRSYEDIAALLGVPKATVGTRILRARRRLRQILTSERGAR